MTLAIKPAPTPLETDPDGVVRVVGTRVRLDTVVTAFEEGATAEEIVYRYPSLRLQDVYAVISYYLGHRQEIEAYLRQREQEAGEIRHKNEAKFDPGGIRDRLLARRQAADVENDDSSGN